MSANYLGDVFKKETGMSAQNYIQAQLIQIAKEFIKDSTKSFADIAFALGFKYQQHFTRFFKIETGMTPKEYRSLQINHT